MNRIDKVVVFCALTEGHLRRILELELQAVQDRIMRLANTKFVFYCSDAAKDVLLREGLDCRYGARHLKRSIEKYLVFPLSNLVATGQVEFGDSVFVDESGSNPVFFKRPAGALIDSPQKTFEEAEEFAALYGAAVLQQGFGVAVWNSVGWMQASWILEWKS